MKLCDRCGLCIGHASAYIILSNEFEIFVNPTIIHCNFENSDLNTIKIDQVKRMDSYKIPTFRARLDKIRSSIINEYLIKNN